MAVAALPDVRRALSASADKTLKLWDLETGNPLAAFTAAASSIPKSLQLCSRTLVAEINSQELHLVRCYRKKFRKKTE